MIELVSSHGGMNYYDYGLMSGFGSLNQNVTLYTSCDLKFDISNNNHLHVNYVYKGLFDEKNKIKRIIKFINGTLRAIHTIKKSDTKIVHFQIFAVTVLETFVVWFAKKHGLKTIVTIHDVESFNKTNGKQISSIFYRNIDSIIVHNKVSYDVLIKYLNQYKHTRVLINNCHIVHQVLQHKLRLMKLIMQSLI